ncbi:unnamed protein product [Rhizophagus irregularis]|nr:unnamed protein product [Rhizophagus irregularis]
MSNIGRILLRPNIPFSTSERNDGRRKEVMGDEKERWEMKRSDEKMKRSPVNPSFFDTIKRNNQYPFLIFDKTPNYESHNQTINNENNNSNICSDHETNGTNMDMFDNLIDITQQALDLLKEQKKSRNINWVQGVERNFNQIKTMVNEVNQYKRRKTMPRTWKDHNHNTPF